MGGAADLELELGSLSLEFCLDGEVMTGGLKGGGCPTFLEGSGGVSRGIFVISGCTPLGLDGAPSESASLAKELFELVSLRPRVTLVTW